MTRTIQLTGGFVTTVDAADFDVLNKHAWRAKRSREGRVYAARRVRIRVRGTRQLTWCWRYMHRAILAAPKGFEVDHIDRDGLNNTRGNLRLATVAQNRANTGKRAGHTSSFKGVCWKQREQKWCAKISVEGRQRHLGYFTDELEAAAAYAAAARAAFGAFAFAPEVAS